MSWDPETEDRATIPQGRQCKEGLGTYALSPSPNPPLPHHHSLFLALASVLLGAITRATPFLSPSGLEKARSGKPWHNEGGKITQTVPYPPTC